MNQRNRFSHAAAANESIRVLLVGPEQISLFVTSEPGPWQANTSTVAMLANS